VSAQSAARRYDRVVSVTLGQVPGGLAHGSRLSPEALAAKDVHMGLFTKFRSTKRAVEPTPGEEGEPACMHIEVVPQWDNPGDLGLRNGPLASFAGPAGRRFRPPNASPYWPPGRSGCGAWLRWLPLRAARMTECYPIAAL